jgi:hypothetical protein
MVAHGNDQCRHSTNYTRLPRRPERRLGQCPFRNFSNRLNLLDSKDVVSFAEEPLMWALENRAKYNRDHLRYPSDLTDEPLGAGALALSPYFVTGFSHAKRDGSS